MDIETLSSEQFELATAVQKSFSNLKKDSSRVRKYPAEQKAEFFKKKRSELTANWTTFSQRHSTILGTQDQDHDYFRKKFYSQTHELFMEYEKYLNELSAAPDLPLTPTTVNPEATGASVGTPSNAKPSVGTPSAVKLSVSKPKLVPPPLLLPPAGQSTIKAHPLVRKQQVKFDRLNKQIEDIYIQLEEEHPLNYWDYKKDNISQQWTVVQQFQEDILVSDEITQVDTETYDRTEEAVQNLMLALCEKVSRGKNTDDKISLPKVNIPIFDGDYQSWTTFHDIYMRMIHNNKRIGNAEKMQFLMTSIKGEALKLLQHLSIADNNYQAAWEILYNRYNNKRILVASHIENIFNLPKMTGSSAQELKQIHDTLTESVRAIGNLGIPTSDWGPLLVHILLDKMDRETIRYFEQSLENPKEVPAFKEAMSFIETRFQSLEFVKKMNKKNENVTFNGFKKERREGFVAKSYHTNSKNCTFCKEQHSIYNCKKFAESSIQDRFNFVKRENLCKNCLNHDYRAKCSSNRKCAKCQKPHHSMLHFERNVESTSTASVNVAIKDDYPNVVINGAEVLLATALVKVKNYGRGWNDLRVLIDQGSQLSFITQEAAENLGLPKKKANVEVSGVGGSNGGVVRTKLSAEMVPRMSSNFKLRCELLIIERVTSASIPSSESDDEEIKKWMKNSYLADPTFHIPGPVDILLGADVIPYILKRGIRSPHKGCLAQSTEFGWIISGRPQRQDVEVRVTSASMISVVNAIELSKFWEIEEGPATGPVSEDDKECQKFYAETTVRSEDGKYTVNLPFKDTTDGLGETRKKGIARLLQMEKKFGQDSQFEGQYKTFMREYEQLGHMVLVEPAQERETKYVIPHHAVLKEDSTTTKLRVVFDASARSSTGKCLNELMHVGPRLQDDLAQILLRWRKHEVVFAADIEKMYRQIKVTNDDQLYQTILWRYSRTDPIQEYRLTTVTYGTSSAPYLAVRTLQRLAQDEETNFPTAAEVTKSDFYVDDMLSGSNTISEAVSLRDELINMMQTGGFNLRKWKSNRPELITALPNHLQDKDYLEVGQDGTTKMLGVHWAPTSDNFQYQVKLSAMEKPTKRKILSQIARLYDPLGWLAPIIIRAKLLMQDMWLNENDWDDEVTDPIRSNWLEFQHDLHLLACLKIPRWIHYNDGSSIELHGFCDASEKAYGAVIYSRITDVSGDTHVTLLTAKSKVAPIKMRKTLPRLELCGAVLLAKLFTRVKDALKIDNMATFAWSDSMIALAWIKGRPERWQTFVGNRVSEVIQHTEAGQWNHVISEENPADLVSRGTSADNLKDCDIWWRGPTWLKATGRPSSAATEFHTTEESKSKAVVLTTVNQEASITSSFSSLTKMIRVIAYCKMFLNKSRRQEITEILLDTSDLQEALRTIVRMVQGIYFKSEMDALKNQQPISRKSKLLSLNPFVDDKGIIRVGGRLQNSVLSFGEKHPIIIPHEDPLANLIVNDAHVRTLHGGNQLTLALVRRKYWITRAGSKVRHCINQCVKCTRFKQNTTQQLMGNLPQCRVRMTPPFSVSGLDYAGPLQIRVSKGRGNKSYKGYVAIFICMATKAIHLEAVSDMTTEAFLAAFKRFVSRKGHCAHLYSDNGTTFVGANKILDKELKMAMMRPDFLQSMASDGTEWHFGPPAAPHFGGLWEAGVKSMKFHLKRVIGDSTLTFEELSTVLCQIEACLNSRPLCVIKNADDATLITPAHLFIGRALIVQPDDVDLVDDMKITTRWNLLKKMKRDFWKIWSSDYLHQLQQRYKWNTPQDNVMVGDIVLIKDDNLAPTKWPMARITELHTGSDGKTRVVSVKTQNGIYKRPIVKLCRLPIEHDLPKETNVEATNCMSNVILNNRTTRPRRQRQQNYSISTLTYLTIVMFVCFSTITNSSAVLYSIKYPPAGLYIEHLGDVLLNRGLLRVDVNLNTSSLLGHDAIINRTIFQLQHVCDVSKALSGEIKCDNLVRELKDRHQDLQLHLNIILNGYGMRTKRGLLGQMLTSVFGVNDEVFTDISKLDANQKQLILSSNQQAAIMLKTVTTLNETERRISTKLNHFTEKLNQGLAEIHALEAWYKAADVNKINVHILYLHQLAHGLIAEVEEKYEKLLRVIHHQGHVIDFLTVKEFHKLISNVTLQLSPQLQIMTQHVVKMELERLPDQLVIHCYFHIAENPTFTLINVTPIPVSMGNDTFAAIKSEESLLAIDYNNQHYFELSRDEFREAIHLTQNKYLVSTDVIHDMNTSPNCIIDTIYSRVDEKRCSHQIFKIPQLVWKHLYMQNTWMFISSKQLRVSIDCSGQREDIWLNGTGVIQIDQGCVLNTKRNVLKTRINKNVQQVVAFHKPLSIDLGSIQLLPHLKIDNEPILDAHDSFSTVLQDQMVLQNNLTQTSWEQIQPHVTTSGISSLVTVIIIGIVLGIAWLCYKRFTRRPPTRPSFVLAPQDVHEGTV